QTLSSYIISPSRISLLTGDRGRPSSALFEVSTAMEIVVRKNGLLRELQLFQGIVERKNTIPILANVLMEAKGDQVSFLATDLEVALRSKCAALVAKVGALTLPAKKFYEIVKSLPETDIRIAEDKGGAKVASEGFWSWVSSAPPNGSTSGCKRSLGTIFLLSRSPAGHRAPRSRAALSRRWSRKRNLR